MTMVPLPPIAVTRAWVIEAPMNSLSGARKVWTLIVSSGAISVSRSMTGMPLSIILLDRRGQRADAERLDGDEVPVLRGHVVDRGALLDGVELAVEPGDVDVEQLAPILGRRLALGAPGGLQAGVGEGGLERLLGHADRHRVGQRRADADAAKRGERGGRTADHLEEFAPRLRAEFELPDISISSRF